MTTWQPFLRRQPNATSASDGDIPLSATVDFTRAVLLSSIPQRCADDLLSVNVNVHRHTPRVGRLRVDTAMAVAGVPEGLAVSDAEQDNLSRGRSSFWAQSRVSRGQLALATKTNQNDNDDNNDNNQNDNNDNDNNDNNGIVEGSGVLFVGDVRCRDLVTRLTDVLPRHLVWYAAGGGTVAVQDKAAAWQEQANGSDDGSWVVEGSLHPSYLVMRACLTKSFAVV